jgi:hypothetical protein
MLSQKIFMNSRILSATFYIALTGCQFGAMSADESLSLARNSSPKELTSVCSPLKESENKMQIHAYLDGTGKFCLVQDLTQRNVYDGITHQSEIKSTKFELK